MCSKKVALITQIFQVYEADTLARFQGHCNIVSLYSFWCSPFQPPDSLTGMLATAGAREVVMPGAGHSPYFEQPGAFNAVLADALGVPA